MSLISLTEAKEHLLVEHDDDDAQIAAYISAASAHVLNEIGLGGVLGRARSFTFSQRCITIGNPSDGITSLEVRDCNGVDCSWSVINPTNYEILQADDLFQVIEISEDVYEAGKTYRAKYNIALAENPEPLKQAAKFLIGHFYENRSAVAVGQGISAIELPMAVNSLLSPYKRNWGIAG